MEAQEEAAPFVWDGVLPSGGTSLCVAKAKCGKTTLLRNLALRVAQGAPFLGRPTVKGTVVYLALEEKQAEFSRALKAMVGDAPCRDINLKVYFGGSPDDSALFTSRQATLAALERTVEENSPTLLIIDTLGRFMRGAEMNDYGAMVEALDPITQLARHHGCHIMLVHHARKQAGQDGDGVLGSTAIMGSVDTLIELYKDRDSRVIKSTQRYGYDIPNTKLSFDAATGLIAEAGIACGVETTKLKVIGVLGEAEEAAAAKGETFLGVCRSDLDKAVGGRSANRSKALTELEVEGLIAVTGSGKKGDPALFRAVSGAS